MEVRRNRRLLAEVRQDMRDLKAELIFISGSVVRRREDYQQPHRIPTPAHLVDPHTDTGKGRDRRQKKPVEPTPEPSGDPADHG